MSVHPKGLQRQAVPGGRSARTASKDQQVSKDYSHVAHQAPVAHRHAYSALAPQAPTASAVSVVRKLGRLSLSIKCKPVETGAERL